jgi:hypothetical protein
MPTPICVDFNEQTVRLWIIMCLLGSGIELFYITIFIGYIDILQHLFILRMDKIVIHGIKYLSQ